MTRIVHTARPLCTYEPHRRARDRKRSCRRPTMSLPLPFQQQQQCSSSRLTGSNRLAPSRQLQQWSRQLRHQAQVNGCSQLLMRHAVFFVDVAIMDVFHPLSLTASALILYNASAPPCTPCSLPPRSAAWQAWAISLLQPHLPQPRSKPAPPPPLLGPPHPSSSSSSYSSRRRRPPHLPSHQRLSCQGGRQRSWRFGSR